MLEAALSAWRSSRIREVSEELVRFRFSTRLQYDAVGFKADQHRCRAEKISEGAFMSVYRSFLFAPGNHSRRVEKALSLDADAAILDLEDACPIAEKKATRALVVAACQRPRKTLAYVRVNAMSSEFGYGDIVAVVQSGVDGILLPKVEAADEIRAVDWVIANLEKERGLPVGACDVIPIIETGKGMANIRAIAAAGTRVRRLAFGAGDFTLDMNMAWSRSETELLPYRSECVLASRAANIEAPIDTVWVDLNDTEGLSDATRHIKQLGFQGKMCIHPRQVPVVNEILSPSAADVEWSLKVVEAFEAAEKTGSASIALEGKFIDYPIVHRARRVLEVMQRVKARGR
jgi:citrate lyase subunit beta / citryl-CoA lyase